MHRNRFIRIQSWNTIKSTLEAQHSDDCKAASIHNLIHRLYAGPLTSRVGVVGARFARSIPLGIQASRFIEKTIGVAEIDL